MTHSILNQHKKPQLTLVGAGPGDPELITLKALNTLKEADIVLYDALVSNDTLKFIPDGIPTLAVGKRSGKHSYKQADINHLIVESAFLYGHVVRLKGGDPFVFGRATEELEAAHRYGIETRVVPGISSSLAVPASLNIPVTSRGISESFWVITGTTKEDAVSKDIALAAKSNATIVILMGLNKLKEIVAIFEAEGKEDTPVAIIQNGTLPDEKSVVGTVSTILELSALNGIDSPAIIVVGEVVRFIRNRNLSLQEIHSKVQSISFS